MLMMEGRGPVAAGVKRGRVRRVLAKTPGLVDWCWGVERVGQLIEIS